MVTKTSELTKRMKEQAPVYEPLTPIGTEIILPNLSGLANDPVMQKLNELTVNKINCQTYSGGTTGTISAYSIGTTTGNLYNLNTHNVAVTGSGSNIYLWNSILPGLGADVDLGYPSSSYLFRAIYAAAFSDGTYTLTSSEFQYLDGQDQAVKTTSSPTFAAVIMDGHTVNSSEWHYLDGLDQSLSLSSNVRFNSINIGGTVYKLEISGTDLLIYPPAAEVPGIKIETDGSLTLGSESNTVTVGGVFSVEYVTPTQTIQMNDSRPIVFGTGHDASIMHDGTNWIFDITAATTTMKFNSQLLDTDFDFYSDDGIMLHLDSGGSTSYFRPKDDSTTAYQIQNASGTSLFSVDSTNSIISLTSLYPKSDNVYYLGKPDDDTPLAWKAVILKDTTNGKYYKLEIINGVVTATDLTD